MSVFAHISYMLRPTFLLRGTPIHEAADCVVECVGCMGIYRSVATSDDKVKLRCL